MKPKNIQLILSSKKSANIKTTNFSKFISLNLVKLVKVKEVLQLLTFSTNLVAQR